MTDCNNREKVKKKVRDVILVHFHSPQTKGCAGELYASHPRRKIPDLCIKESGIFVKRHCEGLNRHRSTILREISRNNGLHDYRPVQAHNQGNKEKKLDRNSLPNKQQGD